MSFLVFSRYILNEEKLQTFAGYRKATMMIIANISHSAQVGHADAVYAMSYVQNARLSNPITDSQLRIPN